MVKIMMWKLSIRHFTPDFTCYIFKGWSEKICWRIFPLALLLLIVGDLLFSCSVNIDICPKAPLKCPTKPISTRGQCTGSILCWSWKSFVREPSLGEEIHVEMEQIIPQTNFLLLEGSFVNVYWKLKFESRSRSFSIDLENVSQMLMVQFLGGPYEQTLPH